MMPVIGNSDQSESIDYKKKYRALKRKLKFLVYEHESFLEELKKAQRKLLKVSRDRSFLLDRLLQHEKVDDSSSDSDATASSDSEGEGPKDGTSSKKRKLSGGPGGPAPALPVYNAETAALPGVLGTVSFASTLPPQPAQPSPAAQTVAPTPVPTIPAPAPEPSALLKQLSSAPSAQPSPTVTAKSIPEPPKKRQKVTKKTPKSGAVTTGRPTVAQALQQQQQLHQQQQQQQQQHAQQVALAEAIAPGHMTREELERHLEYKQSTKPQFMSIDKAPNMLPDDIFNDNSSDSDGGERQIKEEEELVIDLPME